MRARSPEPLLARARLLNAHAQHLRARKTLTSPIIHQTCTKTARTHAESMRMRAPPRASIPTFLLIFFLFFTI